VDPQRSAAARDSAPASAQRKARPAAGSPVPHPLKVPEQILAQRVSGAERKGASVGGSSSAVGPGRVMARACRVVLRVQQSSRRRQPPLALFRRLPDEGPPDPPAGGAGFERIGAANSRPGDGHGRWAAASPWPPMAAFDGHSFPPAGRGCGQQGCVAQATIRAASRARSQWLETPPPVAASSRRRAVAGGPP